MTEVTKGLILGRGPLPTVPPPKRHPEQSHEPVIECCRECRDEGRTVFAEFLLWGKLFPPEALGPRCYEHAAGHIGWSNMGRIDQWSVLDLRHLYRRTPDPGGLHTAQNAGAE